MLDRADAGPARVRLGYGSGSVDFPFDPARFEILSAGQTGSPELSRDDLQRHLDDPEGSPGLESIIEPGDQVCIVVPDITRASGSAHVADLLVRRLENAGLRADQIAFLVGAGTHRAPTAREIEGIVGSDLARRVAVHFHDANDAASHASLGTTSRGTPVVLNRRLIEADRVILVGAIGFHYFAGFSAGRKGVLPACASEPSIQANHLLAFDRATLSRTAGVQSGRLDGNPVSEDMEEAAELLDPDFLVNTVLDGENRIVSLHAGHWRKAHRKGCEEYLETHTVTVTRRRPLVVASCGGAPRDINMIQSHKALEHARFVLEDGGDLVLLAECPEGLGKPDFLDWFVPGGADGTARLLVRGYKIYGQTAWGIRWKSERYRVRLVSSLDPAVVKHMGMIPHRSLDEALAASTPGPGYIMPNALGTLPVTDESGARRKAG